MSDFFLKSDTEEIVNRISETAKDLSGKTILMTGGRGFLGRHYTEIFLMLNESILEKPVKVIVLDNFISAGEEGKNIPEYPNFEFIEHNVIEQFDPGCKVDYIIHAAGIASPFYYRANPIETLDVAIIGTKNMLNLIMLELLFLAQVKFMVIQILNRSLCKKAIVAMLVVWVQGLVTMKVKEWAKLYVIFIMNIMVCIQT